MTEASSFMKYLQTIDSRKFKTWFHKYLIMYNYSHE